MAHDVFISYSHADAEGAKVVCSALERAGIACWIAPRDIHGGDLWADAIVRAIEQCRTMVLILSHRSNASPQVLREVDRAVSLSVSIVPLRVEDLKPCRQLDYYLATTHWLDAFEPPLEQHLGRLVDAVRRLGAGGPSTRVPADPPVQERPGAWSGVAASTRGGGGLTGCATPPSGLLHTMWEHLDESLQDAFLLAYNKKLRDGGRRISTRDLFQALGRCRDDALQTLLRSLPPESLPEPMAEAIPIGRDVVADDPPLSDCVADSLDSFRRSRPLPRRVTPADLFVDIGKHGHGPSVARLRQHGVTADTLERNVRAAGLQVLRPTPRG